MPVPSEDNWILHCGPKPMNKAKRKIYWEKLGYDSETMYHKF